MIPTTPLTPFADSSHSAHFLQVVVVVPGDHLPMAAVGEELQGLVPLAVVPVHDHHVLVKPLPRAGPRAVDEVVRPRRRRCGTGRTCRSRRTPASARASRGRARRCRPASGPASCSCRGTIRPSERAELVVAHHAARRTPAAFIRSACVGQQLHHLRLGDTATHLAVVDDRRVVPRDAQLRAVGQSLDLASPAARATPCTRRRTACCPSSGRPPARNRRLPLSVFPDARLDDERRARSAQDVHQTGLLDPPILPLQRPLARRPSRRSRG